MADVAAFDEFYLATRAELLRQLTAMAGDRASPGRAPGGVRPGLAALVTRIGPRGPRRLGAHRGLATCRQPVPPPQGRRPVPGRAATAPARRTGAGARLGPRPGAAPAEPGVPPGAGAARPLRYPVEQVAAECGVAVGTVKSRLSRGRAALAASLGADYRRHGQGGHAMNDLKAAPPAAGRPGRHSALPPPSTIRAAGDRRTRQVATGFTGVAVLAAVVAAVALAGLPDTSRDGAPRPADRTGTSIPSPELSEVWGDHRAEVGQERSPLRDRGQRLEVRPGGRQQRRGREGARSVVRRRACLDTGLGSA